MPSLLLRAAPRRRRPAHTRTRSKHDAKPLKQCTPSPRRARRPPPRPPAAPPKTRRPHQAFESKRHRRARRPLNATTGASWVLRSLIREASLGIGLGVVFGSVWSVMQTGPVSRRITEYYKNNPTQS